MTSTHKTNIYAKSPSLFLFTSDVTLHVSLAGYLPDHAASISTRPPIIPSTKSPITHHERNTNKLPTRKTFNLIHHIRKMGLFDPSPHIVERIDSMLFLGCLLAILLFVIALLLGAILVVFYEISGNGGKCVLCEGKRKGEGEGEGKGR